MSDFCIVILAAGEGKRMKSEVPKVLHEICSKPLVNYVVDAAKLMAPKKIVVVISRKRPQVREVLDRDIKVAFQAQPLGTADAVKAAGKDIPANCRDVIVLYGDTPLITAETIRTLYDFHLEKNASCTVLTTHLINPRGYGRILRSETGQFIGIVEDKDATYLQKSVKEINTGMYCFKKDDLLEALAHIKPANQSREFYLTDVFSWIFNKNKKIEACVADDFREVLGVNLKTELMEASQIIRQRILENFSGQGVRIADPLTTFIDETAQIGAGTEIFPFSVIEKGVLIGKNCSVGPFCHLREGSVLKDKVSIGNFTEIKNSILGESTRIRHISYIGDTTVGKKVNIGAGAVIANFDGRKKHKTVIKEKAFIGCDVVLVAPVVVGKKAVVGAGSVVTRDHNVPDGALVMGVPARIVQKPKKKR
jgi:bifunctional UDP-N-acetylglucosamine pyrophosphorylase/glucosamine-1-phosphate N-acetyltransferase